MTLTALGTRRYGSPRSVRIHRSRTLPAALVLLLACAQGADRPEAPLDRLHFPAGLAIVGQQLLVANADQDLAFLGGSLVALQDQGTGAVEVGLPTPYMAGRLRVIDAAAAAGCTFGAAWPLPVPFAMVPGRSQDSLLFAALPLASDAEGHRRLELRPDGAAHPYEAALTCGADGTALAWVSFQRGLDEKGYVARLDLSAGAFPPPAVQIYTGDGPPRSFAWDRDHDRLYFTTREHDERAPIRWIDIGDGCRALDGVVEAEDQGGCHVDRDGIDLSTHLVGAEPNGIALSSGLRECVFGAPGELCRRMYLTVRMYDADLSRALDARPAGDVGGKLLVLEVSESGLGRPTARVLDDVDIGRIAGEVLVVPREGLGDLVVATVDQDDLVWLYDDERGAVAKVFGRLATGVPPLGHMPAGLASRDMGGGVVRVFVSSYEDHFVSALDVPLADPTQAHVVLDGGRPLRLGRPQ